MDIAISKISCARYLTAWVISQVILLWAFLAMTKMFHVQFLVSYARCTAYSGTNYANQIKLLEFSLLRADIQSKREGFRLYCVHCPGYKKITAEFSESPNSRFNSEIWWPKATLFISIPGDMQAHVASRRRSAELLDLHDNRLRTPKLQTSTW